MPDIEDSTPQLSRNLWCLVPCCAPVRVEAERQPIVLDVLARLVYSGEGPTQPLVDDSSLTKQQKWQLLFDRHWRNLAPSSQTKRLVYLREWKVEQPEGYLVFPSSKVSAFLSHILADCTASSSKDLHGAVKSTRKASRHLRAGQTGIPEEGTDFPSQPYIAGVASRAKTATAEPRQWSVAVCWQSILAGQHCFTTVQLVNNALTEPGSTFSDAERACAHTDLFQFASLVEQRLHRRATV
ncbi:hypothetical protein ABBQ32_008867 [Trebouxia sp. C0010 RCD-2024]